MTTVYSPFFPGLNFAGVRGSSAPFITEEELTRLGLLLDELADDGVLTVDEKIRILIPLNSDLETTYSVAHSKATSVGIPTGEMDDARAAWLTYRDSLIPAWNDITQPTTIDRTTFRTKIDNYLLELRNVESEISGQTAITGFLTNESHTVAADSAGNVLNFTNAGGTFKVYDGNVDVTFEAVFAVESATNLTITIDIEGNYTITAMAADTASAVLTAEYNGVTITKQYSISKSKGGANAVIIYISSNIQTVPLDSIGSPITPNDSILFTAVKQNTTATVAFAMVKIDGTPVDGGITLSGTGDSRFLSHYDFNIARGYTDGIIVKASITVNGITYQDQISVVRVQQGKDGSNVVGFWLISDRQTIRYDTNGNIISGQSVTFIAQRQNTTDPIKVELLRMNTNGTQTILDAGTYLTGSGTVSDNIPDANSFTQTGSSITMTGANFNTAISTGLGVIIKCTCFGLQDQLSVSKVQDGSGTFTAILSNESHTLAADYTGALLAGELAKASGTMSLYYGSQLVTSGKSYSVASQVGVAGSTIDTAGNYQLGSAMTSDTATVGYRVTGSYGGSSYDITKLFTATKAKQGAPGPPGPAITITADKTTIEYVNGVETPVGQICTLTATVQNSTGTINWTTTPNVKTGTGTTFTITSINMGTNESITVQASDGTATSQSITITKHATSTATDNPPPVTTVPISNGDLNNPIPPTRVPGDNVIRQIP